MTTADPTPMTRRELGALAAAAAAVTLALGVTLAALAGGIRPAEGPPPEDALVATGAPATATASSALRERVVLVPVERSGASAADLAPDTAEPTADGTSPEAPPRWSDDDDEHGEREHGEREHGEREHGEREHGEREHHGHGRHARSWSEDEEGGLDG